MPRSLLENNPFEEECQPLPFDPTCVSSTRETSLIVILKSSYNWMIHAFSCREVLFTAFYQVEPKSLFFIGLSHFRVEPAVGVEPTTCCLQNRCSTTDLCRRIREVSIVSVLIDSATGFPRLHRFKTELQSVVI